MARTLTSIVATRKRRALAGLALIVLGVVLWAGVRRARMPKPPRPDAATFEQSQRVTIVRDTFGVPHVFGKSDGDAAFGLAYAHAEDDWPTIQAIMAASTGRLGLLVLSKKAAANDYYAALVGVREQVAAQYDKLSPAYRDVLEGYARGLNLYAYLHPGEADGRLFPLGGRDVAASFAHKLPLMFDLGDVIAEVTSGPPKHKGERLLGARESGAPPRFMPGSNAHAVLASRSTDGTTRLNVNSHQPWEGPVSWYEAHVVSEQGWNMTGGTFPGAPMILHGHNDVLGWAHTVNTPDLVDVYELVPVSGRPDAYMLDGAPRDLEVKTAHLVLDTGLFDLSIDEPVYRSAHGPVMKTDHGMYAFRYAGIDGALAAGEQWYRMNKAKSLAEWQKAMQANAIPMFNTVYADATNVLYVYNAKLPNRREGYDYGAILPGDASAAIWNGYFPFDSLPMVHNPPSGFVQTCNSTPYLTTTGFGNPLPDYYPRSAGIETKMTNRATRSLLLFGTNERIGRDDFLRFKFDRAYQSDAAIVVDVVQPLLLARERYTKTHWHREALDALATWDRTSDERSIGATVAILTWARLDPHGVVGTKDAPVALDAAFDGAVAWLVDRFGATKVPLGDVQRLRRGAVDLPLGGGPDVLNAVRTRDDGQRMVGFQGDSYVLIVELAKGKTTSTSIHQYGASNRKNSAHYADQSKDYVRHVLKPTWRDPAELAQHTERSYHPGEERR